MKEMFVNKSILAVLAVFLCIGFSMQSGAQNLELRDDDGGGQMSSSCLDDCWLDSSLYNGGSTVYLLRDSSVVDTMWVDADIEDSLHTGDLTPPNNPPENGTVTRRERFPGFSGGGVGDWEVTIDYTWTQGILTEVQVRADWRPACTEGMDCDEGDEGGGGGG